MDSLRTRLGARYVHTFKNQLQAYAGAAWEYETDGEIRSRLNGDRVRGTNELKGHSALMEVGVKWHGGKDWTLNAKAEGLLGRREGVTGMLMANYRF